jgi:hypothetical protein
MDASGICKILELKFLGIYRRYEAFKPCSGVETLGKESNASERMESGKKHPPLISQGRVNSCWAIAAHLRLTLALAR